MSDDTYDLLSRGRHDLPPAAGWAFPRRMDEWPSFNIPKIIATYPSGLFFSSIFWLAALTIFPNLIQQAAISDDARVSLIQALGAATSPSESPTADLGIYAIGISIVGCMVLLAGMIPARRAASIDPATALRTE
jgi:ABC-type antimicrobial peptide transport system permease subunit